MDEDDRNLCICCVVKLEIQRGSCQAGDVSCTVAKPPTKLDIKVTIYVPRFISRLYG